jgi:hypothetical protein
MSRVLWIAPAVLAIFCSRVAHADLAAASFAIPQSPSGVSLVNGLDGFDFTPTADLTVTALGWYDHNGDGLTHDHPVGIYNTTTQTLVAPSVLVTNTSPLDSAINFRFTAVPNFTLTAGTTYTLVGYGEGPTFDPYVANPSGGITFGTGVGFLRHRTARASGLEFPTTAGEIGLTQALFFGPNFQFVVPEPAGICLAIVASVGLLLRMKRENQLIGYQ